MKGLVNLVFEYTELAFKVLEELANSLEDGHS